VNVSYIHKIACAWGQWGVARGGWLEHITHAVSAQLKRALAIGHRHAGSDSRGRLEGCGLGYGADILE